jgi:hypothetical protein
MQISDVSASRRQPTSWARRVGDGDEVVNKWGAIVRRVLIRCQETVEFDKLPPFTLCWNRQDHIWSYFKIKSPD